jgi:hypothetical protein
MWWTIGKRAGAARRWAIALTAAVAFAIPTATAQAAWYQVGSDSPYGVDVYYAAMTSSRTVATLSNGEWVDIVCQAWGGYVFDTTLWDWIDDPVYGWVSDLFTTTPNRNQPSPGLSFC